MIKKTLFVYNSLNLFHILNEIKKNFYFELEYIDAKNYKKINFEQYKNYLIISTNHDERIKNCIIIDSLPTKLIKLVEIINLSFLKKQFKNQSEYKIGKYTLDLNSRRIYFENKNLSLTEKESDLILFINSLKRADLNKIQKTVWGHSNELETHTVETHIYRLRKKIFKTFDDHNFIKHDRDGYFIN
jgi:DNA-binding response OmpR family regulator